MNKKYKLFITSGLLTISLATGYVVHQNTSDAAIAVVDAKNILETNKAYIEAAKSALNTAEQITLQTRELLGLPGQYINQAKSAMVTEMNNLNSVFDSATGMLNPNKSTDQAWNESFYAVTDFGNNSVADRLAMDKSSISALNNTHKDAFNVIKENTKSIDEDTRFLSEAMDVNAGVEGNKQALQLQNTLMTKSVEIQVKQAAITSAASSATVAHYQRQNQVDAQAADLAKRHTESIQKIRDKGDPFNKL